MSEITYTRERTRVGPLPLSTKIFQGVGALPDTYKNFAFGTFLLFFYNQVLHLPAGLASAAIMIALVLDAVTDPLVGSLSDNFHSKLGRRHPLMYGSALPLGLTLFLTFSPPAGLSEQGLFVWLTVFAVLVRTSMTFFIVPWNALFAEFSDDYVERTSVVTYRYFLGWTGGIIFTFCTWTFVFPSSPEFTPGHLNPEGYDRFAPILGGIVALAALFTTHLTRREIPYLLQPSAGSVFSIGGMFREVMLALRNRDFLAVFLAILIGGAIGGVTGAMEIYLQTFFWGLTPEDLRWFAISFVGALAAFLFVVPLQRRFDKKTMLIFCLAFNLIDGIIMINLRLFDILPPNGDPLLLMLLIANTTVRAGVGTTAGIIGASMIADTLDQQELTTNRRQEGVFSAALSFSGKATSGVGVFVGGLILQFGLAFPAGISPKTIDAGLVVDLGIMAGILVPLFHIIPLFFVWRYRLTRDEHAAIRAALDERTRTSNGG